MPNRREVYAMDDYAYKAPFAASRPQGSQFPNFHDGDVKVVISPWRQFQLHKSILTNNSTRLNQLLADEHTVTISKKAKEEGGVIVTNMVKAVANDYSANPYVPEIVLEPVKLDGEGGTTTAETYAQFIGDGVSTPTVMDAFERVLGALYHRPIDFSDESLSTLLRSAIEVLAVAEYLGCVNVVTQHFEANLLAIGQKVYRSISTDPPGWIDLSTRVQSKQIYREAVLHAIGQLNTAEMQEAVYQMDEFTAEMIITKGKAIMNSVSAATTTMLSYYPLALQRTKKTDLVHKDENSRNSYGGDILHWMALTIFRQWLSQMVAQDQTHNAADMGYGIMSCVRFPVANGTSTYLPEADMQAWHGHFPMSPRGTTAVRERLDEIKQHVSQWAAPLFANNSMLDVEKFDPGYFTGGWVAPAEYPWVRRFGAPEGWEQEGAGWYGGEGEEMEEEDPFVKQEH